MSENQNRRNLEVEITDLAVTPLKNTGRLLGLGNVVFNGTIRVSGIKILEGDHGEYVQLPTIKNKMGKIKNIITLYDHSLARYLEDKILEEYYRATNSTEAEKNLEDGDVEDSEPPSDQNSAFGNTPNERFSN